MRDGLRFGLLGPPVLYAADGSVTPVGGGKTRALLVALLLEPGRVVPVHVLKDALWDGAPPASAHASLQNHVSRLRRLLDCPTRLRAVAPGYLLRIGDGELDVQVFERRLTAARAAHTRRDWTLVRRESDAALALWRGTPLSGLPPHTGGHALVPRLEEARLQLLEWRYDAELRLAEAADGVAGSGARQLNRLAPELAALVAEHPLRESFHRLLMLVLHRTGRQAEALAVHRDLRARLIGELGIEPGPAVREAHLEILQDGGSGAGESGTRESGTGPESSEGCEGCQGSEPRREPTAPEGRTAAGRTAAPVDAAAGAPRGAGEVTHAGAGAALHSGAGAVPVAVAGAAGVSGADAATETDLPLPAQLPPAPAHFIGRWDIIEDLHRVLGRGGGDLGDAPRGSGGGDLGDGREVGRDGDGRPGARTPVGGEGDRGDGASEIAVLSGMAGVGKSALALHVAHALRKRFPDGQLYVNLHGATPGMTPLGPGQALASLLRDLGTEPRRIPEHPDAAAALLRSVLAPTRTLMVLDDAANAAQVRPLLPAGAGCAVIVTSRSPLTALDGAHRFPLPPLSDEESAELLRAVSGRDEGLDGAHPLVELTGRLPLALRIVAARLAARRALTPDVLAGQLAATEGRLHHFEYDDLSVRRSLAVAHDALRTSTREADRDAALALLRIGALDLPGYGVPLLARLTGTDARRAEAALDRLVDVALLEETAYGRYAPHDLVRDFAREIARPSTGAGGPGSAGVAGAAGSLGTGDTGSPRVTGTEGLTGTGTGTGSGTGTDTDTGTGDAGQPPSTGTGTGTGHAGSVLSTGTGVGAGPDSGQPLSTGTGVGIGSRAGTGVEVGTGTSTGTGDVTPPPSTGTAAPGAAPHGGEGVDVVGCALRWYAAVAARSLDAIVESGPDREDRSRPTASQPPSHAADVASVPPFASAREAFAWGDQELENVVALVERYAHSHPHVLVLVRLIHPYVQRSGRVAELEVIQRAALGAARRLGDEAAEAYALGDLAGLHFMTGRTTDALALNDRALALWRRLGVLSCVRRGLNNRGMLLEGLGRYAESGEALLQSLELSRTLGDPHTEAVTYSHLGNLYEHTDPRAAIAHHKRSLAIGDATDDVILRHSAHCNIGFAHLTLGEPSAAVPHFEESLRILDGHGYWHGESQTRLGLVRALRRLGSVERAARECEVLLRRADRRADRFTQGLARHQRGLLLRACGRLGEAYEEWESALDALAGRDTPVVEELAALLATR
ncbi:BTAD domain-containing putative transcriptional regulator [Streptomyces sp. NPDC005481]|uniref:AfsR/SARP family transcriptional regulator n=1 Tax=Streptomyces sp. NPDC005481 TaxID=3154881 RepID=UPI0033AF1C40